jgi:acetolactate synthase I/II/III large subunit
MSSENATPVTCGADAFVALLAHCGSECLFLNSGTDTFPIQESITRFESEGHTAPRVITCPDELVAISAAHGHYLLSRQPQTVLVHVDAGTMQLGGGLHNAQRARAGMVLCAGKAPLTIDGETAGGRNLWIHWIQDQPDQAMGVRGYTKWVYDLHRNETIHHVVPRAFQVAGTEPAGPTYLTLPREVLMEEMTSVPLRAGQMSPPVMAEAAVSSLSPVAEALAHARRPLILTGYAGRNPESVTSLIELAELIGAPVVTPASSCMNFPNTHNLWGGITPNRYLSDADVVLIVDCDVPYIPADVTPQDDAQIFWIDMDPLKSNIPLFTFPADLRIQANSADALPVLVSSVRDALSADDIQAHEERTGILAQLHGQRRAEMEDVALEKCTLRPIAPEWLTYCIDQALDPETIVLDETVTNLRFSATILERKVPGTWFTSGGASLGWALGAAVGVKLAAPDRQVVALVGDGTFLFGCPSAALWTAAAHDTPFLTIIYNNQMHFATKRSWLMHYPHGHARHLDQFVGTDLQPSPDFAQLAKSCHAFGRTVTDPAELPDALERALQAVAEGQAAVLDVRIERP